MQVLGVTYKRDSRSGVVVDMTMYCILLSPVKNSVEAVEVQAGHPQR